VTTATDRPCGRWWRRRARYRDATLPYLEPPAKGDPRRRGEAKAGNLSHALDSAEQGGDNALWLSDFLEALPGSFPTPRS